MYNPEKECSKVAERLRRYSEIRGISCQAAAEQTGLSVSAVQNLMDGKKNPSIRTLYQLCNALDISMEELLLEGIFDKPTEDTLLKPCSQAERAFQRLSEDERNLVALFRYFPEKKRQLMRIYMDMLVPLDMKKLSDQ